MRKLLVWSTRTNTHAPATQLVTRGFEFHAPVLSLLVLFRAVAAAEVMTDRTCIHSAGVRQPYLSAKNILSCCGSDCGSCDGGMPLPAFQWWQSTGVVTGGDYGADDTCQPYYLPPCAHHTPGSSLPQCVAQSDTPSCSQTCTSGQNYAGDKHFGASAYALPQNDVAALQQELMQNGPIEVGFMVYADFPHYKSGVYSHVQGDLSAHTQRTALHRTAQHTYELTLMRLRVVPVCVRAQGWRSRREAAGLGHGERSGLLAVCQQLEHELGRPGLLQDPQGHQ